jgi:hypothetical protein
MRHNEARNTWESLGLPKLDPRDKDKSKEKGKEKESSKKSRSWKLKWMCLSDGCLSLWKEFGNDKSLVAFDLNHLVCVRELPSPHQVTARNPFLPQVHICMRFVYPYAVPGIAYERGTELNVRFTDETTHSHLLRILHRTVKLNSQVDPSPSQLSIPRLPFPEWREEIIHRAMILGRGMSFLVDDFANGPWQPEYQEAGQDQWGWDDTSDVEWDDWRCDFEGGVDTIGLAGYGLQFRTTTISPTEREANRSRSRAQSVIDENQRVPITSTSPVAVRLDEADSPRRPRSSTIAAVRDGLPSFAISASPPSSPPRRAGSATAVSSKNKRRPNNLTLFYPHPQAGDSSLGHMPRLEPRSPKATWSQPMLPPEPPS